MAPMIASVASVTLSCSDSNQRSRIGVAAPVRISTAFWPSCAELAEGEAELGELPQVAGAERPRVGRRLHQRAARGSRRPAPASPRTSGSASASLAENLRDLAVGERLVGTHQQRAAVGERGERRRIPRQHLEPVPLELEVADDLGPQQAVDVGGGGDLVAGPDLLGDAGAAEDFAPLEHEHLHAGPGQVGGGHQTVVAAADDDEIVGLGHRSGTILAHPPAEPPDMLAQYNLLGNNDSISSGFLSSRRHTRICSTCRSLWSA